MFYGCIITWELESSIIWLITMLIFLVVQCRVILRLGVYIYTYIFMVYGLNMLYMHVQMCNWVMLCCDTVVVICILSCFEDETSLRGVECKTPYFHMPWIVFYLNCAVVVIVAQVENWYKHAIRMFVDASKYKHNHANLFREWITH